jgi:hypothetical protein
MSKYQRNPMIDRVHDLYPAYRKQWCHADERGIEFNLTFREWLDVWTKSRKLSLRGVGAGKYCMSRHGDVGPYALGNVKIVLNTTNSRTGMLRVRAAQRAARDNVPCSP